MPAKIALQVALDMISAEEATEVVCRTMHLVDRVEVGTPLLLAAGFAMVGRLRQSYREALIVADTKICDAGERIARTAFDAGANVVTIVTAAADPPTWEGVARATGSAGPNRWGRKVMADLIGCPDLPAAAQLSVDMGADELAIHLPKRGLGDDTAFMRAANLVRTICDTVAVPVFLVGGLTPADRGFIERSGASGIIVGKSITTANNPGEASLAFKFGE